MKYLTFEDMIESLSRKHKARYSYVYDLMAIECTRLVVREPIKYMFTSATSRDDAFPVIDKYLGIKNIREEKYNSGD